MWNILKLAINLNISAIKCYDGHTPDILAMALSSACICFWLTLVTGPTGLVQTLEGPLSIDQYQYNS